jgi:hypothetical protein
LLIAISVHDVEECLQLDNDNIAIPIGYYEQIMVVVYYEQIMVVVCSVGVIGVGGVMNKYRYR